MWKRWHPTTHIWERSYDNGTSWSPLPLSGATITEGQIPYVAYVHLPNNYGYRQVIKAEGGSPTPYYGLEIQGPAFMSGDHAGLVFNSPGQGVDNRKWRMVNYATEFWIEALNDAESGVYAAGIKFSRSGTTTVLGSVLYLGSASGVGFHWDGTWGQFTCPAHMQLVSPQQIVLNTPTVRMNSSSGPYFQWNGTSARFVSPYHLSLEAGSGILYTPPNIRIGSADGEGIYNDTPSGIYINTLNGGNYHFRGPSASSLANSFFANPPNGIHCGNGSYPWYAVYAYLGTIQASDRELKSDIRDDDLGLSFVEKLKSRRFKLKHDSTREHVGFVTQEVEEALDGKPFAALVKNEGASGLNYAGFVPILTKAIQELSGRLKVLEDANGR